MSILEQPEPSVILFVREECHLCEVAAQLLLQSGMAWKPLPIDDDPVLEERYGLRVPVVRLKSTGQELDFPFDGAVLGAFLNRQGRSPADS